MKILVSAITCGPSGSESQVGWNVVKLLAKDHDVWVLTHPQHRKDIEEAKSQRQIPENVHFIYHGRNFTWHPNRLLARLQSWKEYLRWNKTLLIPARAIHKEIGFDLVHHVTYASWRVGSPLWQLGIPLVWGPVGGVAFLPYRFYSILSNSAMMFEGMRELATLAGLLSLKVRRCVKKAAVVLVSNEETWHFLKKMRGTSHRMEKLCPVFFSAEDILKFSNANFEKKLDGPLRLFCGGNLIGTKGVSIALQGLALAKRSGVNFRYRIGGTGPEGELLKNLTARLDLQNEVLFGDPLRGEHYVRELRQSHVYLLPSFRENAPITIMEAMLAGCVPVVADASAQAEIVTDECGYRIPIASPSGLAQGICEAICLLDKNRKLIETKGKCSMERIATNYTAENYHRKINAIYQSICKPQEAVHF